MNLVLILIIVACVLLTLIVLIQNPKGGGIAANFSAGNQIMGVKRTNDFVEKGTWTLAAVMAVLILASNFFGGGSVEAQKSVIQDQIESGDLNETFTAPQDLPKGGAQDAPAEGNAPDQGQP